MKSKSISIFSNSFKEKHYSLGAGVNEYVVVCGDGSVFPRKVSLFLQKGMALQRQSERTVLPRLERVENDGYRKCKVIYINILVSNALNSRETTPNANHFNEADSETQRRVKNLILSLFAHLQQLIVLSRAPVLLSMLIEPTCRSRFEVAIIDTGAMIIL